MKRIIPLFLIILTLFSVAVSAGFFPQIVAGTVQLPGYSTLEGLTIEQKNLRTDVVAVTQLDASGFYQIDWANYKFLDGDQIELSIKVCQERAECRKVFTLEEGTPLLIDLFVPSSFSLVKEEVVVYVCSDGSKVGSLEECPIAEQQITTITDTIVEEGVVKEVIKEVVVERYVCRDNSIVSDLAECPESNYFLIVSVIGIIIAGLGALWSYYKNKDSNLRKKYRWIPGFKGILQSKLDLYITYIREGKKAEAKKLEQTLKKYSETITTKYLKQLTEEEKELEAEKE